MLFAVATIKPWNVAQFHRRVPEFPGEWRLLETPAALEAFAASERPRYIFFPHWSWRVPAALLNQHNCVCFHMTDLPFGRGGSPLQNLIATGRRETKISALRMVEELDAGDIYLKRPLDLSGSAQQIYERAAGIVYEMIGEMARTDPAPIPQLGEVTTFHRRRPEQSLLPDSGELGRLYDHIRMLDAETYPHAFVEHGEFRLEFSDAELEDGRLSAKVTMSRRPQR